MLADTHGKEGLEIVRRDLVWHLWHPLGYAERIDVLKAGASPADPFLGFGRRSLLLVERIEARHLTLVGSDHELPALLVLNLPLQAERLQQRDATHAQSRLQRTRRVVETGMYHPGVVTGLMPGQCAFLLQHHHIRIRLFSSAFSRPINTALTSSGLTR